MNNTKSRGLSALTAQSTGVNTQEALSELREKYLCLWQATIGGKFDIMYEKLKSDQEKVEKMVIRAHENNHEIKSNEAHNCKNCCSDLNRPNSVRCDFIRVAQYEPGETQNIFSLGHYVDRHYKTDIYAVFVNEKIEMITDRYSCSNCGSKIK